MGKAKAETTVSVFFVDSDVTMIDSEGFFHYNETDEKISKAD
ncbi:hypothetical protein ACVRW4_03875 [Streptococcus phocae subsp. phocae]